MSDPTSQLTDRFQLLGVPQGFMRLRQFGRSLGHPLFQHVICFTYLLNKTGILDRHRRLTCQSGDQSFVCLPAPAWFRVSEKQSTSTSPSRT